MIPTGEEVDFEERIRGNSALREICAWCHTIMQEGEDPATHGICPKCQEKEMRLYCGDPAFMKRGGISDKVARCEFLEKDLMSVSPHFP